MLEFYGGSSKRVNLDNLKSGVITPDIYDPTINRTFAEACEHYGVLVDPARVASPKQKGKVERMVPDARELYKRLDALYPQATLEELNEHARLWCLQEYGGKKHGTTGIPPRQAFEEIEKPLLRPLPDQPFVPATWRMAKVHPDQFIQSGGKYYGFPPPTSANRWRSVSPPPWSRFNHDYKVVRTYPVSSKRRMYLREDFPEYAQPFVPGSYASFLCAKAQRLGSQVEQYIRTMLESGATSPFVVLRAAWQSSKSIRLTAALARHRPGHHSSPSLSRVSAPSSWRMKRPRGSSHSPSRRRARL